MIDLYYIIVMCVTCAWIWGFEYTFKPGEIFGLAGIWMERHLPIWFCKPTFTCKYCMSSIHGTIMYWSFIPEYGWMPWIIFCFCLTGLTAMIDK